MGKLKVATVWLCGCSGCHMSFLDLDERLVDLSKLIEINSSPITDVKEPSEVDLGLVEGGIANEDNLHYLLKLREKSKLLISFGDCAGFDCVPMLRNLFPLNEVLERGYVETESTASGEIPRDPELPKLFDKVQPIRDFVKVDFHIPGCPPSADTIFYCLTELVNGRIPVLENETLKYD